MTALDSPETLSTRVRALRRAKAWSQEQLAGAAAVSLRTVQRVERGEPCAPETLQALASVLDAPVGSLAALAPARALRRGVFGLRPQAAVLVGMLLVAPAVAFIAANVGAEELGLASARWLFPSGVAGGLLSSPLVLLGGPLAAVTLMTVLSVELHVRRADHGVRIDGATLDIQPLRALIAAAGLACMATLLAYVAVENLGDHVAALVDAAG